MPESNTPETMTAIEIAEPGGPEVLKPGRRPVPGIGAGELLIAVHAAGVNRPDVMQRQGAYPPPPGASDIPGLEVAGRVAAVGADVTGWNEGDPVCALLAGGGYAEYAAAPAGQCLPVPDGFSMNEAAALPENYFTVWANVFDRAGLRPGESLLVHGGASGIGTTAIQLGRAFGARVFTTAGSAEKCAACEKLGAERAINYREEDFVEVVKEATGGSGVNVVLDMIGGDYIPRNMKAMAAEGRHVTIAFQKGPKVEVNFTAVLMKRLVLTGSTLRARPNAFKADLAAKLKEKVWPKLSAREVAPVMDRSFPLTDAAAAHARMEASEHVGKIVLTVRGG